MMKSLKKRLAVLFAHVLIGGILGGMVGCAKEVAPVSKPLLPRFTYPQMAFVFQDDTGVHLYDDLANEIELPQLKQIQPKAIQLSRDLLAYQDQEDVLHVLNVKGREIFKSVDSAGLEEKIEGAFFLECRAIAYKKNGTDQVNYFWVSPKQDILKEEDLDQLQFDQHHFQNVPGANPFRLSAQRGAYLLDDASTGQKELHVINFIDGISQKIADTDRSDFKISDHAVAYRTLGNPEQVEVKLFKGRFGTQTVDASKGQFGLMGPYYFHSTSGGDFGLFRVNPKHQDAGVKEVVSSLKSVNFPDAVVSSMKGATELSAYQLKQRDGVFVLHVNYFTCCGKIQNWEFKTVLEGQYWVGNRVFGFEDSDTHELKVFNKQFKVAKKEPFKILTPKGKLQFVDFAR